MARDDKAGAFPALTASVLAGLGLVLGLLTPMLRWVRSRWLGPVTVAAIAVLVLALLAIALRRRPVVGRIEARLRRAFTPPRRLTLTREGKYFVGICLGIGFAAINTGNNLLYLLLGMMLSLIIASGILSEMSLRGLVASREPPSRLQAGVPALMGLALQNGKRRFPSFSVEVEDILDGEPLDKRCWFLKIPAAQSRRTNWRHQFPRRGLYRFTGFRLATKFPFALFRKSRDVEAPGEVVVYPRLRPVDRPPPPLRGFAGDESRGARARRGEFHGLREFRDGDDVRDVHWRTTARRGRLMVREHEEEEARRVSIFLDNALPGGHACTDEKLLDGLERAVSTAASLVAHYLGRGFAVRVVARGEAVPWAQSAAQLDRVLRALALLPTVEPEVPFAAPPEPGVETLFVGRPGAAPPTSDYGRAVSA